MDIRSFSAELHPSTIIYSDPDRRILAALQIGLEDATILVGSTLPNTEPFKISLPRIHLKAIREDVNISSMPAYQYPVTQRGALRKVLVDAEANKLIDGQNDAYTYQSGTTFPGSIDEAIVSHYEAAAERETTTIMFAVSTKRTLARLGKAILYPLTPADFTGYS